MTSPKIKQTMTPKRIADEKRIREIADVTEWSGDNRVNMTRVMSALRCAIKMLDEDAAIISRLKENDHEV